MTIFSFTEQRIVDLKSNTKGTAVFNQRYLGFTFAFFSQNIGYQRYIDDIVTYASIILYKQHLKTYDKHLFACFDRHVIRKCIM